MIIHDGEYALHCRLKNNLIYGRIMAAGYKTVGAFCRAHGLQQTEVGLLINLRKKAVNDDGSWKTAATKLADALSVDPDDLFTEQQKITELPTNTALVQLPESLLMMAADPSKALESRELKDQVIAALLHLPPRHRKVLELRYFGDMKLADVGDALGVSLERARQMEAKALRALRHPSISGHLRIHIDDEADRTRQEVSA